MDGTSRWIICAPLVNAILALKISRKKHRVIEGGIFLQKSDGRERSIIRLIQAHRLRWAKGIPEAVQQFRLLKLQQDLIQGVLLEQVGFLI